MTESLKKFLQTQVNEILAKSGTSTEIPSTILFILVLIYIFYWVLMFIFYRYFYTFELSELNKY